MDLFRNNKFVSCHAICFFKLINQILFFLFITPAIIYAQKEPVQNIRGTVMDMALKQPLAGATVHLADDSIKTVLSGSDGIFNIQMVPVGRHNLIISYTGYKTFFLHSVAVEAGKETVLNIEMEEEITQLKEVTISSWNDKNLPVNKLAMLSARKFSVEETRRFAAGINDPSRIATGFAGVSNNSNDGNALIIRGNAPNALLWRLEGVDIPNPNHFAKVGTSGGAISILSAQLLDNSDLMMGAFPSEYGNALSGVFDIHLRKGNNKKREHTAILSIMGVDFATEGYFNKKHQGSYLVNYRYSFLSIIQKMKLYIGDAPTQFQDLSYNINLPTKKYGQFTIFGFGGNSKQEETATRDSVEWLQNTSKRKGWLDAASTGATGITHQLLIGKNTLLKTVCSINGFKYRENDNRLDKYNGPLIFTRNNQFIDWNMILSVTADHKINSHHLIKVGIYGTAKNFDLSQKETVNNILQYRINSAGSTRLFNSFLNWKWDITNQLRLVTGLHSQFLVLNITRSLDPRFAIRWKPGKRNSISIGYGHHTQMQPLGNYFARIKVGTDTITANKNMDFSKAHHYVISYENQLTANWNIKTELYYQSLYNIPVTSNRKTNFSLVNMDDDYVIDLLANNGKGKNYGIEFSLERSWNDLFYLLATISLYQSKYLPSDNIWRDTRYNSNTTFTLLAGKEWMLGGKQRPSSFSLDIKMVQNGGVRVTPIDLIKSIQQRKTVFDNTRLYEEKLKNFFRLDVQAAWKIQFHKMTGSAIVGVQNLTDHRNPIQHSFDPATNSITYKYLLGRIPVFGFKIDL